MSLTSAPTYRRVLLKLSGESLQDKSASLDANKLAHIALELAAVRQLGTQIAIVIGGGNFIRGSTFTHSGLDRVVADQMGMLATIMNGLALQDIFTKHHIPSAMMSAFSIPGLVDHYERYKALELLQEGRLLILTGGTGNPLVTTDSAAALRGVELGVEIILKATKVDGVFSEDPVKNPDAQHYQRLNYEDIIKKRLAIMDLTAILLCQNHHLPVCVFNMNQQNAFKNILLGENIGTMIGDFFHASHH